MANYTTNYNLKKPLTSELFTVNDANGNMDLIDTELKNLEDNKVDKVTGKSLILDTAITDLTDGNETTLHKHNATNTPFTPTGSLSSTNVQTALAELDTEKASKVQETWITSTLLNGATGDLKYRKDQMGRVQFKGSVAVPLNPTTFMTLPAGYRITIEARVPVRTTGEVVGTLRISTSGNITTLSGANAGIFLTGVSYETE